VESQLSQTPTVWKVEPGEQGQSDAGWMAGIMENIAESSEWNRKAAAVTGLAAFAAALSAVLNVLAT
jgi:hypothetical protein